MYETTECKTSPVVRGNYRGAIMRPSYVQGGRKFQKTREASKFKRFRFERFERFERGLDEKILAPFQLRILTGPPELLGT